MEVNEDGVKLWLNFISSFMEKYAWLADSFVLDFFTKSHWQSLPTTWSKFLIHLTPQELADLIDPEVRVVPKPKLHIAPLSLFAFKSTVSLLSIRRTYDNSKFESLLDSISNQPITSDCKEFSNLFRRHVKLKKRHEVEQIGKIVSRLSSRTNSNQVYDVGSGLGHLSRFLTYEYGLKLTCVDKELQFGEDATKFDKELKSFLEKKQHTSYSQPPSHTTINLQFGTSTELFQNPNDIFGFTGLHSCGNLSSLIINQYVTSQASFVVSLGCCYMKMDEMGFPLSNHLKSLNLKYSYESLEVACHAIEKYCERLRTGHVKKLITHCYRATLETVLEHHGITHEGLRSVPHTEDLSFQEYALRATSSLPINLAEHDLNSPTIESKLRDWFKVVLFYSLRLMIARVIESSIILDRSLYIHSSTPSKTYIVNCFDPKISPRNIGIISYKST